MIKDENSGSVDSVVATLIENAKSQLESMSTGVQLALAELRVVVVHAGLIVCLIIVAAGMIIVGWSLLLLLSSLLLVNLGMSAVSAVLCVWLANCLALAGVCIAIRKTLAHLSFRHTRQALNPGRSSVGYAG